MYKRVLAVAVIFLVSVVLTGYWGTSVVGAAEKKEGLDSKAEPSKAPEEIVNPHLTHVRFFFQDSQMDFFFGSLILGATVNHGCEIGEAFYTAAQIKDGDAASWQQEWLKTARLVEARGEKALAGGAPGERPRPVAASLLLLPRVAVPDAAGGSPIQGDRPQEPGRC